MIDSLAASCIAEAPNDSVLLKYTRIPTPWTKISGVSEVTAFDLSVFTDVEVVEHTLMVRAKPMRNSNVLSFERSIVILGTLAMTETTESRVSL